MSSEATAPIGVRRASASPERPWRRLLRNIHLWVGLILALPLVLLGLTGSILVFHHEFGPLLGPAPVRASAGPAQPLQVLLASAGKAAPAGSVASTLRMPEAAGDPVFVRFAPPGRQGPGGAVSVLVDPVSAEVLAVREGNAGVLRQIHVLHANLMVEGRTGREIVGWLGAVMLVLGISGIVLWWPRRGQWRAAFVVKRGARGLRLHRDLHGAVGIWAWAVFILVSFSGVYLAFPDTVTAGVGAITPTRDFRATANAIKATPVRGGERLDPDGAAALAEAALPGTAVRFLFLPNRPDQPYRVGLVRPGHAHGAPMATAFVDPWAGRVLELRDPETYSTGETVIAWQRALHAGEGFGWVWKILVFLSGLLPLLFVVTGFYMWLLKRRARRAVADRRTAAAAAE